MDEQPNLRQLIDEVSSFDEEAAATPSRSSNRELPSIGEVVEIAGSGSRIRMKGDVVASHQSDSDPAVAMSGQVGSQVKMVVGNAWLIANVRTLAAEAGKSAREVAELVSELRSGIDAAARAMQSGEAKVRDIGAVAAEADGALQELHQGVQLMGDLVNATAEVSRSQAQRLADLAQSLQQVASISTVSSDSANSTAAATEAQITSMGELTATSQQLAQLAERLRGGIARFSVLNREQATRDHQIRPAAD